MKVIVVTGTPGTGKTTVSLRLAKKLGYRHIDVTKVISKEKLSSGYDQKRRCKIIDVKKLCRILTRIIKDAKKEKENGLVIDSHLAHELPASVVDLCIVTKCGLKLLKRRMKRRGYSESKIKENLECEIFDVCLNDANDIGHNILVAETDKKVDYEKMIRKIKKT